MGQQIAEKEVKASSVEGDLRIEKEWRTSLQETMVKDRDKISQLHQELAQLKAVASVSLNFLPEYLFINENEKLNIITEFVSNLSSLGNNVHMFH